MTKSIGVILACEVGFTETRLALCGLDMGRPVLVVDEHAANADAASLAAMVHRFLKKHPLPQLRAAAFAVPGPVHAGVCLAASLPWPVEAAALAAELSVVERVVVLNDVVATAHAIPALSPGGLATIHEGDAPGSGNQAVVSTGACPGMAGLFWNGTEHRPFASDGAHADFAPRTDTELALAAELKRQVGRVTVELLLSSAGLELIHRFVLRGKKQSDPADANAILSRALQTEGADPLCARAVDLFLSVYGSAAGNLALTLGAVGGVYLAGSMVTRLRERLGSGAFHDAFVDKAPMQEHLRKIPVQAIVDTQATLLGAANVALRDLRIHRGGGWGS